MLKVAIDVVHEDGTFSHGQNVEDCKDEILKQIGEEIDDRVIRIEIKKRPMRNTSVCETITDVASTTEEKKSSELADIKKVLLEQAKSLGDYNRSCPKDSENIRKNTDTLMRIYSYVLNL